MTLAPTLATGALIAFVAAGVYAYVGTRLAQRRVSPDAQLAATLFSAWWFGLAGVTAIGGLETAMWAAGVTALMPYLALTLLNILLVCVALLGLLYYLVYLFTGKRRAIVPLAALYVFVVFPVITYALLRAGPVGLEVERWDVSVQYAQPLQGAVLLGLLLLLVLPQIIGALAYFSLYFRVKERTQRFRIAVVSWSIILWFGTAIAASTTGLSENDSWQLASRFIGLAAALAILVAYEPPGFLKRRLGVASIRDEVATG